MISYLSKIDINRPIYFLCGPVIKKNSKRMVLHNYMLKQYSAHNIRPFPIIVDDIFKSRHISTYNLDIGLLEEIVSAISYRTYIFLDSLSTAYEYGSFQNSKTSNNVVVLLEDGFEKRERRTIGQYLKDRFNHSKVITYSARITDKEREYFEFKNNQVPDNISDYLEKEINDYSKNVESISFIDETKSVPINSENYISVKIEKQNVSAYFSLKSLFYFMSYYLGEKYDKINQIKAKNNVHFKDELSSIKKTLMSQCLSNCGNELQWFKLYDDVNITIKGYDKDKVDEIIRHVYFFFVLLNGFNYRKLYRLTSPQDCIKNKVTHNIEFESFFDNLRSSMADEYIKNPDSFVDSIHYVINSRKRTIHKYKDCYKGRQLRQFHEIILDILESVLPTNQNSFAYKKDLNTLKCIERHKSSLYFLKTDVHHFFESIKFTTFYKMLNGQLESNLKTNGIKSYGKLWISVFSKNVIKSLFYKGKIPLGFISSPRISDYYLKTIDDEMSKNKRIIYTRYADDILMSSCVNENILNISFKKLENHLSKLDLTINPKKTIRSSLVKTGDYIKYLGIVIVKKGEDNIIKISKKYIKETVKLVRNKSLEEALNDDIVIGRLRYIKSISFNSYKQAMTQIMKLPDGIKIYNAYKAKIKPI